VWQHLLLAAIAIIFLAGSASAFQSKQTPAPGTRKAAPRKSAAAGEKTPAKKAEDQDLSWLQDLLKDKDLMAEVNKLGAKLKDGIQYPAARSQSRLLATMPESTTFYVALPNYGETLHQALEIFQQELRESAPLRDFLRKNKLDATEPKIERGIQQFYEFSQFLGDEVVITGKLQGQEPIFFVVAEVKKPGLREYMEKLSPDIFPDKTDRPQIFGPQELAASKLGTKEAPIILVRPDLVAFGLNGASLREFNAQLDDSSPRFTSTALGQRVAQSYQGGTNSVIGIDLQKIIGLAANSPQSRMMLEKTGFGDAKYLVTENRISAGRSANQMELTFNGPRHGVASWIAGARPMGGLDFISSNSAIAGDLILKDPALVFDDLREIMGDGAFASLPQMEAQLGVNLKQDLLSKLSGEIAFELHAPPMMASGKGDTKDAAPKGGAFKVILGVLDPAGLQQTLDRLLVMAPMQSGKREQDGVTIHTLTPMQSSGSATEFNYFFMDGYLVVASDRDGANEAIHQHRTGDTLGKSAKLREGLGGQSANASILMYQNAGQMLGPMFAQLPPELRQLLPTTNTLDTKANVFYVNADRSSFRGSTSDNINTDLSVGLIVAAVAIPNLLRSRIAANESAAASTVRTVNVSEISYSTTYPNKGYAPSLAAMGPPAAGDCLDVNNVTSAHACLLDNVLGNASCTSGKWCTKGGYRYSVRGVCVQANCKNYVVTATPASKDTGTKSFCSVADAVVRTHTGAPLETPLTVAECSAWKPLSLM
jgi:type II secretory pathway pseudopilin PulG